MILALNIFCAFLCWSMAKKRGRRPFSWFMLGLFFQLFAVVALFFLGARGAGQPPVPDSGWGNSAARPPQFTNGPGSAPPAQTFVQRGHVDLNALRTAVRSTPRQEEAARFTQEELQERRNFLDFVASSAPALDFGGGSPETTSALRQAWLNLGQVLADSGFAGGVTDGGNFYETGESGIPVEFYPVSPDGSPASVSIQFALALKEFQSAPPGLQTWVSARFHDQFGDPVLYSEPGSGSVTLLCAGVAEPEGVDATNLDQLCGLIRNQASVVKRDLPPRFGGLWL